MAKKSGKRKASTRSRAATEKIASRAARKGWETRRRKAEELQRKRAARARKAAATRRRKAAKHAKRSQAAKKGTRRRKARERAGAALDALVRGVDSKARAGLVDRLRDSWHRAKRDVYESEDSYEDYLDVLEQIAEQTDVTWDIAYGPDGEAAA